LFKLIKPEFIRYFVVSLINTIFGYGLYALLIYIDIHYTIASFVATLLGVLFNFKTIGIIVFKCKDNWLIFKFFGVYGITYILGIIGITLFKVVGINEYISGAILTLPMGLLSYFLNKYYVFKKR